MTEVSLLDSAVSYAEMGWKVHPLKPCSKEPNTFHGFKDATTDVATIKSWWADNPEYNIGIAADDTNLYVLDIDGPEGQASLAFLIQQFGQLPETLTARTGKGLHYFFSYTGEPLGNTAGREGKKLGKGIDTRGTGGYIVAPPSIHPDGRRYEWLNWGTPLAVLPEWVVRKLKEEPETITWKPSRQHSANKVPQVQKALETVSLNLANSGSPSSTGSRNQTLNEAAFTMGGWVASGNITREEVEYTLGTIAYDIGLTDSEIRKTLASGIDSGMQQPIYPKTELLPWESEAQQRARVTGGTISIARGSTFKRTKTTFFWNNRIPVGKLTILAGQGGVGKSYLMLSLAAHITNQVPLMDVNNQFLHGEVLFCSYEDDVSETIAERAELLGVDLHKCHFITGVKTANGERDFGPQDVPDITEYLQTHPAIKLIVIDPLGSFMSQGTDMNAENQTRGVLGSLVKAAATTGTAIVVIAHLRKSLDQDDPIHRISGSVGITNISRSVLMVERDAEDPRIRWVKHRKSNLTKPSPDIAYTFDDDGFKWYKVEHTLEENAKWLSITLGMNKGWLAVSELFTRFEMHNRAPDQMEAARNYLGIEPHTMSGVQGFVWDLNYEGNQKRG